VKPGFFYSSNLKIISLEAANPKVSRAYFSK